MDRNRLSFAVTCGLLVSLAGIAYELLIRRDIWLTALFVLMGLSFLGYYLVNRKRFQL